MTLDLYKEDYIELIIFIWYMSCLRW
ncbi:unnamed protein product [Coffea canephora]|uniref:Uncharacterized protein n=1 Tax=Coffea canephora TaxID=49390 RepID=A0A068VC50_COFCA|nr:unnamed protein product [Coffea canephora]